MSYSQIKKELGVSKSTLSIWLYQMPLASERICELTSKNEKRIERCREAKAKKKMIRQRSIYRKVSQDVGTFTKRELLITGFFLYWGEGSKTDINTVSISNTDPSVVLHFKKWLLLLGASEERMRVYVHLYSDMDQIEELKYWALVLDLPPEAFRKPYIKSSKRSDITYTQKFAHGTCNLLYHDRKLGEYVQLGITYLQDSLIAPYSQM